MRDRIVRLVCPIKPLNRWLWAARRLGCVCVCVYVCMCVYLTDWCLAESLAWVDVNRAGTVDPRSKSQWLLPTCVGLSPFSAILVCHSSSSLSGWWEIPDRALSVCWIVLSTAGGSYLVLPVAQSPRWSLSHLSNWQPSPPEFCTPELAGLLAHLLCKPRSPQVLTVHEVGNPWVAEDSWWGTPGPQSKTNRVCQPT